MAPPISCVIIGGGPAGLTAALLLARLGTPCVVLERARMRQSVPRATAIDDECLRTWQACGVLDAIHGHWASGEDGSEVCTYMDDRGRTILSLVQSVSDLGHPGGAVIHEAALAQALADAAAMNPAITLREGAAASAVVQDDQGVTVHLQDGGSLRASWAIACDGADSTTRHSLGIGLIGGPIGHDWLVANTDDPDPTPRVMIRCSVRRPSVMLSLPHGLRRIECMLHPGEEQIAHSPDGAMRIMADAWPAAAGRTLLASRIVRFHASISERWRLGRVFLAGDAAHQSPPFAAQGISCGLRDITNLTWKLAGVVQGWLPESVLDTYESERRPHQERMLRLAMRLGRIMAPRSTIQASLQSSLVRVATRLPPVRAALQMRGRTLRHRCTGSMVGRGRWAGTLLPQPRVLDAEGTTRRLDDVLDPRWTLLVTDPSGPDPRIAREAGRFGGALVLIEGRDFVDPSNTLRRRFGDRSTVLVRPDRVVLSHA